MRSLKAILLSIYLFQQLLTWKLEGRGRTLSSDTIRTVMHKAFKLWSDVTNMDFEEIEGDNPDIWVKFVRYYHDDPYSFDGEGGTLAHAFYPHNQKGKCIIEQKMFTLTLRKICLMHTYKH